MHRAGSDGRRSCGVSPSLPSLQVLLDVFWVWPDTRLSADETARQLRARLRVEWTFSCTPMERDESIPADIDYYCDPSRHQEIGYFVDTDRTSIEIVAVTG